MFFGLPAITHNDYGGIVSGSTTLMIQLTKQLKSKLNLKLNSKSKLIQRLTSCSYLCVMWEKQKGLESGSLGHWELFPITSPFVVISPGFGHIQELVFRRFFWSCKLRAESGIGQSRRERLLETQVKLICQLLCGCFGQWTFFIKKKSGETLILCSILCSFWC